MEYMYKIEGDYLTEHSIITMINILDKVLYEVEHMTEDEIRSKYALSEDIDYYHFRIDLSNFLDSYWEYSKRLQKMIKAEDSRKKKEGKM